MPTQDRDYIRGSHPLNRSCVNRTNRRLKGLQSESRQDYIPRGRSFVRSTIVERRGNAAGPSARAPRPRIPNRLKALLLVFILSLVGLRISTFVDSLLPLWLLLGFSVFYSIENWFYYPTRRHKGLGKLYRLVLNVSLLLLLGLLIWSGIKLFSQQLFHSPPVDALMFLAQLGLLIGMGRTVSRNSWRWPSMKLTVFWVSVVAIVFAFAGVQPMASYKDGIAARLETYRAEQQIKHEEQQRRAEETTATPAEVLTIEEIERQAFNLINQERQKAGLTPTSWDDALYCLSKDHTEDMANKGTLFHAPVGASYAENAWGASWSAIRRENLANTMVNSWMSSPLHRAWMLHGSLRTSVVSIVDDGRGQYASWTFWMREAGQGPPLVQKAYNIWTSETGGQIPWLTWLYDVKGYPHNTDWLMP